MHRAGGGWVTEELPRHSVIPFCGLPAAEEFRRSRRVGNARNGASWDAGSLQIGPLCQLNTQLPLKTS